MSLCGAVSAMVNVEKAYRLTNGEEVSTVGLVGQYAWLILTAGIDTKLYYKLTVDQRTTCTTNSFLI